jgi:BirA family biotin operon repressor/biotin-[acetyl-CoA-carboxylase] ligase
MQKNKIIGRQIIRLKEIDSTNNYANQFLARDGVQEGLVVQASSQTKGRGHQLSSWQSEIGKNLLFSIVLCPGFIEAARQFSLSMAISLGIVDFLGMHGIEAKIKWPNDIYHGNKKLAGILIENTIMGNHLAHGIVGIGLNVNQASFPGHLPNPVSMRVIAGHEFSLEKTLEGLLEKLDDRYLQLQKGDEKIHQEYEEKLYLLHEKNRFSSSKGPFTGKIEGVGEFGRLMVRVEGTGLQYFDFKEIRYG